jgi:hypothetical protein
MRILFDHGTPAPLRRALTVHTVSTAYEMGWAELDNGALLRAAEADFDVLVTTDRNLRYQQNLSGRQLAILILPTNSWPKIQGHQEQVVAAVDALHPGDVVELNFS